MAEPFKKPHLVIDGFNEVLDYKYPNTNLRVDFKIMPRNRQSHGQKILQQLIDVQEIFEIFEVFETPELPESIQWDEVIYVEFYSPWGFEFKTEQFDANAKNPDYQLLNIQKEIDRKNEDESSNFRFKALVMLKRGGISKFIKRTEDYLFKETRKGIPKSEPLIANIEELQYATLKAFWVDGNAYSFPERDEVVWWEVWFRKSCYDLEVISKQIQAIGGQLGLSRLEFSEHVIHLVKATAKQLSDSLFLLDSLAELRRPQEMNDFITDSSIDFDDKVAWIDDLLKRTNIELNEQSVLICHWDSGLNNQHPLLTSIIPDTHLYCWNPAWGVSDSYSNGGHGTGMAGLALYGDLTDAFAHKERITIYHGIESFKIIQPGSHVEKELFGVIYKDASTIPIIECPTNPRIFCLAVTNQDIDFFGRPSSSSASIDQIAFGKEEEGLESQLILISGGNVFLNQKHQYPDVNFFESIQDPGQAYNALTVGAFTKKDKLKGVTTSPIAEFGAMSPYNSTSGTWESQWPNKPDIVFEGGNMEMDGNHLYYNDLLNPLSLHKDFNRSAFLTFGGTSAAVAFAAKMAAELKTQYPDYWPETIRGLMVHSANWTEAMLKGRNFIGNESDRRAILRSVGYGVPDFAKAMTSANNSLTLIAQEYLSPYKLLKGKVSYNEYHLFQLPWPMDVLLNEVAENDAIVTVTLSYFIEPNPGNRQYAKDFSYHSHDLDFKLIKNGESLEIFKRRISSASNNSDEEGNPDLKSEPWAIRERVRSKGSIKKDFFKMSGAELSERYFLAIYPKSGWYRTRAKRKKYDARVRYGLIITIETPETSVDIYTPVEELIKISIPINV